MLPLPRSSSSPTRRILELPSALTGKQHELIVGLPPSYASEPERSYPVIYLLDGYWDFNLVNTLMGGLIYDRVAPELIVVGLVTTGARTRATIVCAAMTTRRLALIRRTAPSRLVEVAAAF